MRLLCSVDPHRLASWPAAPLFPGPVALPQLFTVPLASGSTTEGKQRLRNCLGQWLCRGQRASVGSTVPLTCGSAAAEEQAVLPLQRS